MVKKYKINETKIKTYTEIQKIVIIIISKILLKILIQKETIYLKIYIK
jgi:hypothetical protein